MRKAFERSAPRLTLPVVAGEGNIHRNVAPVNALTAWAWLTQLAQPGWHPGHPSAAVTGGKVQAIPLFVNA